MTVFSLDKGGQALTTCATCYGIKMSYKTSMGIMTSKKKVEDGRRRFRGGGAGGHHAWKGTETPKASCSVAWAHLEKYCESHTFEEALSDIMTVPASVLFGRKRPAGDDYLTSWKCAHTAEAEEQMHPAKSKCHYSSRP